MFALDSDNENLIEKSSLPLPEVGASSLKVKILGKKHEILK